MSLTGNWQSFLERFTGLGTRFRGAMALATREVGLVLVERVREGIRSQAPAGQDFAPLHPFTAEEKGSELALVGGLEGAVAFRVVGSLTVWVGVPPGPKTSAGVPWALVARVHERGAVVQVSERQRAYLHARGLHLRPDTTHLVIPARPFVAPVLREARGEVLGIFARALREVLGR